MLLNPQVTIKPYVVPEFYISFPTSSLLIALKPEAFSERAVRKMTANKACET